ncbi:hypothetical protein HBA92_17460 [Ochrobactrum sp. MR28]|nr:hypothetical protein [Ochrobactrum sp. MR28]MBX8817982.1 hypothetical protein [Ochrobactrum sp. MR31]
MSLDGKAAAWRLLGMELPSGWKITEAIGWDPLTGISTDNYNGSGGNFSVAYVVQKGTSRAFLKAIDLTSALTHPDIMGELHRITSAHNFEAKILQICEGRRLDRVVVALESGQIEIGPRIEDKAPYLIFELADGDVRRRIQRVNDEHRLAWWLHAMHHMTVGLHQLHTNNIAHQDLKPSNILAYNNKHEFRVADLGRSIINGVAGPHDDMSFSGDFGYAPPEILYQQIDPDWNKRRLGGDLYLLGSMIIFFATGFGCTQMLINKVHITHRPPMLRGTWNSDYVSIVPILQNHFTEVLNDVRNALPESVVDELTTAASQLCNLDPNKRGHPQEQNKKSNPYSLVRYIALFDKLAKQADIQTRKIA